MSLVRYLMESLVVMIMILNRDVFMMKPRLHGKINRIIQVDTLHFHDRWRDAGDVEIWSKEEETPRRQKRMRKRRREETPRSKNRPSVCRAAT